MPLSDALDHAGCYLGDFKMYSGTLELPVGSTFDRFSAKLGPWIVANGSGAIYGGDRTKTQPGSATLRPSRDHVQVLADSKLHGKIW